MADEIARGYPDFLAGLNLDPDALTNYPKLTDHSVTTGRNLPTSSRPNSSIVFRKSKIQRIAADLCIGTANAEDYDDLTPDSAFRSR